ncbi:MAG: hypothetical protein H6709_04340 [Kofleriaceae bacterium]|nr:hypothetical protein [Myxococcales bacterium]MCB9561099.1 hypothetical protein [Kofleriaceae bacterium]MCB9571298.1 hypothetical protein [Kofleriaceae bacterium]
MQRSVYKVSRVRPQDVRAELERLWDSNLTVREGVAHKYEWLYRDAPELPTAVFLLDAETDGAHAWVGTAGVGVRRIWIEGREGLAGLLADLAVDRAHRSVGPALTLVRTVKAWVASEFEVAWGFPNFQAVGVFKRAGYAALGVTGRWVRVLRHGAYAARLQETPLPRMPASMKRAVERAVAVPAVASLAGGTIDVVRLIQGAPQAIAAARRVRLRWLDAPDERIDQIWARARGAYPVVGVRSSRFLRWRFPARDGLRVAVAEDRDGNVPRAYAIIEHVGDAAHIRDLFGERDAIGTLLDLLPAALYPSGAVAVSMRYLGAPWLVEALEARGFSRRPGGRTVAVGVGDAADAATRAVLTDVGAWYLTDADEDT